VVLTGVNTGDFGKSSGESFLALLQALAKIEGIPRWRISSIEPNLLTIELLEWIARTHSFLPHFHLPLQSGSDTILRQMRRRYNRGFFADRIKQIKALMPYAFIGVDVIVGFPGEREDDFLQTYTFLEELSPSFLHVFPYSRRPNTPAAELPNQVSAAEKKERVKRLLQLSDLLSDRFYRSNIGRMEEVLFEASEKGGLMSGFTRNYIKVKRPFQRELVGEIVKMELLQEGR